MSITTVAADLVARICRDATTHTANDSVGAVAHDPLDGTVWVRMSSWPGANEALKALNAHGISGHDLGDSRLHVTGWDVRLLHWRLGALLAGVDDLTTEWDATAEMVCYHHDRRVDAGIEADPAEILADVESALRSCVPIPHRAPRIQDVDTLLELIAAAEDAYQQLIAQHVDYAEQALTTHIARPHNGAA